MLHELKIRENFADDIVFNEKNFEIRFNDRGYQKGDKIRFTAVDSLDCECIGHPINKMLFKITYVLSGWGLKENYVALSIVQDVGGDRCN